MADLSQPSDIKSYFSNLVTLHSELSHFASGNYEALAQSFKDDSADDEYTLYLEWPQKRYRDQDGAVDAKLITYISVLTPINKKTFAEQDAAIDKCMEIMNDILIRMRNELFYAGYRFSINDVGTVDPVKHYMIANCFGCRVPIELGDWIPVSRDAAKWSDL